VKTYVEWLKDLDYDPPACGLCKNKLLEGEPSLRLLCLDLYHAECLHRYGAALPSHTAKAGYVCPLCSKGIIPEGESLLAGELREVLGTWAWAKPWLSFGRPDFKDDSQSQSASLTEEGENGPPKEGSLAFRTEGASPLNASSPEDQTIGGPNSSYSISSRKPRDHIVTVERDYEDEDKYKKRSVTQLFTALGLISPSRAKSGRQVGCGWTPRDC